MLKWLCGLTWFVALTVNGQQLNAVNSARLEKAYQQVLYHYYQGDFSAALTQLAILEQKFPDGLSQIPEFLSSSSVEPELLKGGISLAYGLDSQAADIFQRLLKNNTSDEVTAYAWLLLGKTYYQKGQFVAAAEAFQNISQHSAEQFFEPSARDNWLYMQSQLHGFLLNEQSTNVDVQWLAQLSNDSIYRDYVQYNQALALLQNGQSQQAISLLSILTESKSSFVDRWMSWADPIFSGKVEENLSTERDAIRDRANLTLGYTLLQNDQAHNAFRVFENIRTDGLDAEAALLGYGWAAAKKNEFQTALAIWQSLMLMPQNSEYTLEAYLASAYVYEKAFAPRQSLLVLQQGIQRFELALTNLNQAQLQVNQRQFILDLLANSAMSANFANSQTNQGEISRSLADKGQQFNTIGLFNSVAASNEFTAGLLALQQNQQLQQQLNNWQQQLQHYHLMLNERQAERLKRAKQILQNRTLEKLPQLHTQRDALAQLMANAKQQQDGQVFMSQQSQKWLERVTRSQQRLANIAKLKEQLGQPPLANTYQKRVERVAGRLVWQASEAYSVNQWQAQKALNQLDSEIGNAQQSQQLLLKQLSSKPDFAEQRLRVSNLSNRVSAEMAKSQALQDTLISQLSLTFNQFIQSHKQKVSDYILQAQLAMVRLSDQALQKDSANASPSSRDNVNLPQAQTTSPNEVEQL